MAINNKASESKYNIKLSIDGSGGVLENDNSEMMPCHAETQLRIEVTGVGPTSEIQVYGRIRSSDLWHYIATIVGPVTGLADISTYDYVRYFQTVVDGTGTLVASGFITNKSSGGGSGGGDASEAQQIIGNNYLNQINQKSAGSLLANIKYDKIEFSEPSSVEEQMDYYLLGSLTATVLLTYTDSSKSKLLSAEKI